MKTHTKILTIIMMISLISMSVFAATSWPSSDDTLIATGYEFSGAVWDENTEILYSVHDNGYLISMDADGSNLIATYLGGDLEGITIVPEQSGYQYIMVEYPQTIKEVYNGVYTGKEWDLSSYMSGTSKYGAEALTWIPAGEHGISGVETGVFAAGSQMDGKFYLFSVDFDTSNSVVFYDTISASNGGSTITFDLAGSQYDSTTQTLYGVYDSGNHILAALQLDSSNVWQTVATYSLPGSSEEGVAIIGPGTVYLAEDNGYMWMYENFDLGYPEEVVEEETIDYTLNSDSDALFDYEEIALGTDPYNWDTDGDHYSDSKEVNTYGTDPLDRTSHIAEKIIDYSYSGEEVSWELYFGEEFTASPFSEEEYSDIIFAWTTANAKVLYVTNGRKVVGYQNGEIFKEKSMGNWKVSSYEQTTDSTVTITYNSGYVTTIEPFAEETSTAITHIWLNTANSALYVANADNLGLAYKNGYMYKEFRVNPAWFTE